MNLISSLLPRVSLVFIVLVINALSARADESSPDVPDTTAPDTDPADVPPEDGTVETTVETTVESEDASSPDPTTPDDSSTRLDQPEEPGNPTKPADLTDPTVDTAIKPVVAPVPVAPMRPRIQRSRRLNGHLFNPTETLRDPFPSTYFGLEFGSGFGTLTTAGNDADIGSLKQTLSGQVHVYKGLSIGTRFGGTSLFDNDTGVGASVNLGYQFDARYGFDINEQFRVAVALDTNIRSFGLFKNVSEKAFGGSAQAAWSGQRWVGVFADVGAGYGTEASAAYLNAGLGLSLNPPALPIAVLGTYRLDSSLQDSAQFSHIYGAALHYTGRENFVLGLEVQGQSASQGDADIFAFNTLFRMRYYWDADTEFVPEKGESM